MDKKICSCCGNELSIENFSFRGELDKSGEPKRRNICRSCVSIKDKERKKKRAQPLVDVILFYRIFKNKSEAEKYNDIDELYTNSRTEGFGLLSKAV